MKLFEPFKCRRLIWKQIQVHCRILRDLDRAIVDPIIILIRIQSYNNEVHDAHLIVVALNAN